VNPKAHNGRRLKFSDADKLFDAVIASNFEEVQTIVASGTDVNVRDAEGMTPLHRFVELYVHGILFFSMVLFSMCS
jgi:hypothetical protein